MKKALTIQAAKELLHTHMKNKNLRRHCYAVAVALVAYFDYYKSIGRDTGELSRENWEIVGILHDSDWEETTDDETKHTLVLLEWLGNYDVQEEILNVFKSHNSKITQLMKPETLLEWTLECCDELTGFIVAVALVMPNKKLADVTVERIFKKFKQKEFARAVERTQITQCKEKIDVPLPTFVEITLKSMQQNADSLGL